jgi:hypothetical protein
MSNRPWKVRYHYDGSKCFPDPEHPSLYVIDTSRPINGLNAYSDIAQARRAARTVSRNGGTATVLHRDHHTGEETTLRQYEAYEVALAEAAAS